MIPPSISGSTLFTGARPRISTPPQSPEFRDPAGLLLVKTMGFPFWPLANIWPPRETMRHAAVSPKMIVPGWIVKE